MKKLFTLFTILILSFNFIQAQIDVSNVDADDEEAECEGQDPDANAIFNAWFGDVEAAIEDDATSACGNIVTPIANDYDSDDWISNTAGCDFEITITWTIEDDCTPPNTFPLTLTFTIEDTNAPQFVGVDGSVIATLECDGAGNATDIQDAIDNFVASLSGGDFMEACTSGDNLVANVTYTTNPDPAEGTEFDCEESIFVDLITEDDCGAVSDVATVEIIIEDTADPTLAGSIADLTIECGEAGNDALVMSYIAAEAQALIDDGDVTDGCSPAADIMFSSNYNGDLPDCSGSMTETIVVTYVDLCGEGEVTTSFDIIADDTEIPLILNLETDIGPLECVLVTNSQEAADAINAAVAAATFEDPNGCTTPENLLASIVFNPNPIPAEPTAVTDCESEYLVDITVTDDCGNVSAIETVTVTFEDTTAPTTEVISNTIAVPCLASIGTTAPPIDVEDDCEGQITIQGIPDLSGVVCETEGFVIFEYEIEDACGNVNPDSPIVLTFNIEPIPGNELEWLDPDDNLPEGISLTLNENECMNEYLFPNCEWSEDPTDPGAQTWPNPSSFAPGVHYNDPCGTAVFTSSQTPCPIFPGAGDILVTYTLDDGCGDPLIHEFTIEITCANCNGSNGIYCELCDDARPDGCFTCNVNDLLQGFASCNPPYEGMIQGPPQPATLCNGAGVPNNMSWFAFVAGAPQIEVEVCPSECIPSGGSIGIQSGIYEACDGECIAGDGGCPNTLRCIEFSLSDMTVGNTYFLFVDGCNGAECQYEITIAGQEAYVLDDFEEVVPETECQSPVPGKYCPGQQIRFNVNHDGSSPTDNGDFDDPGPYDPEADLCFEWSFSPELDGFTNEIFNQLEVEAPTPWFTLPSVTSPTTITVCLDDITGPCEEPCDDADCVGECCIDILVEPLPDEVCVIDVCIEDLVTVSGFDPSQAFDDLCGGGVAGWLGATNITLADVDNNDTLVYTVVDPDCECEFQQKLVINPIGNRDKTDHTWYMYECQFKELELDGDIEPYEYVQPQTGQEVDIDINSDEACITLFQLSQETDWESESCDSIILLTVDALEIVEELTSGPCTSTGTEYFWELLLDDIDTEWPEIQPNYLVEWVDCDDVNSSFQSGDSQNPNPPFSVTSGSEGEYCVRVAYQFTNFNFPEGSPELTGMCEEIFGPYNLVSDQASPPIIEGDTEFCANDLVGKEFTIATAPGSTDTYTWNIAGTGAVIMDQSNGGANITFDLTDFDFSQSIVVDAQTACGDASGTLNLSTIPVPVPAIDITPEICIGESATAFESNYGNGNPLIVQYDWMPINNNSAGPVEFTAAAAGTQEVFLTVTDINGCVSDPVMASYEVIAPLETPAIECGSISDSSLEFVWGAVDGATGYSLTVVTPSQPNGFPVDYDDTVLSHTESGLSIGETVTVTITALGAPPCGDSDPAMQTCITDDCPNPLTMFTSATGSVCENESGVTFPFDLNATILDSDGNFTETLTPPGTYFDLATGIVDPTGLPVGVYTVSTLYNYNNDQCPRQGPTFTLTVEAAPVVEFTLSALEVCVGESITIDDSAVTPVATFDYGVDFSRDNDDNITWTSPGVKTIRVDVETTDGCMGFSEQIVTVQDSIILGPILCESSGLDFANFNWDDVPNVLNYTVSSVIDGGTPVVEDVDASEIQFTGLGTGVSVQITVTANPAPGFCPTVSRVGICETSNCPDIDIEFNAGPFCYGQGSNPIDLELVILDPMTGTPITDGSVQWGDARVVDGIFTPDLSDDNEDYNLNFTFTDADGCESGRSITVEVIAEPNPMIATIDGFCVDNNGVVELIGDFNNGEEILWEWEGSSATGAGPHDISFAADGLYEVTVTVINGVDAEGNSCEATATASVLVDPALTAPVFVDCNANNTGVTFEWGPVANASAYEILVDGVAVPGTPQDSTTFMIPAVPGESFNIEVIAISSNNCQSVSNTDDCTATNCAPATFANLEDVEMCLDGTEMEVQFDAVIMNAPAGNPIAPGAWSGTGISPTGLFNPAGLSPEENILLSYSVEYPQDCIYNTNVFVTLFEAPQVTNIVPTNPDCYLDQTGGVEMTATGGTPPYSYQVENLPAQDNGAFSPLNPGVYNVTVTDVNGCMSDLQFDIISAVEPPLGIDGEITLLLGEVGTYTITDFPSDLEIGSILWTATPIDGGEVITICDDIDCDPVTIDLSDYPTLAGGFDLGVTVIFNDDCFQEAMIRVDIVSTQKWYIPNVFSTNSEGADDQRWQMWAVGTDVTVNDVRVYDRWGELVHQKLEGLERDPNNNIDLGWEGVWSDTDGLGQEVEQGVYVYMINMTVDGREVIEAGDVTVLR